MITFKTKEKLNRPETQIDSNPKPEAGAEKLSFKDRLKGWIGELGKKLQQFAEKKQETEKIIQSIDQEASLTQEETQQLSKIEGELDSTVTQTTEGLERIESAQAEEVNRVVEPLVESAEGALEATVPDNTKTNPSNGDNEKKSPESRRTTELQRAKQLIKSITEKLSNQFGNLDIAFAIADEQSRNPSTNLEWIRCKEYVLMLNKLSELSEQIATAINENTENDFKSPFGDNKTPEGFATFGQAVNRIEQQIESMPFDKTRALEKKETLDEQRERLLTQVNSIIDSVKKYIIEEQRTVYTTQLDRMKNATGFEKTNEEKRLSGLKNNFKDYDLLIHIKQKINDPQMVRMSPKGEMQIKIPPFNNFRDAEYTIQGIQDKLRNADLLIRQS